METSVLLIVGGVILFLCISAIIVAVIIMTRPKDKQVETKKAKSNIPRTGGSLVHDGTKILKYDTNYTCASGGTWTTNISDNDKRSTNIVDDVNCRSTTV